MMSVEATFAQTVGSSKPARVSGPGLTEIELERFRSSAVVAATMAAKQGLTAVQDAARQGEPLTDDVLDEILLPHLRIAFERETRRARRRGLSTEQWRDVVRALEAAVSDLLTRKAVH